MDISNINIILVIFVFLVAAISFIYNFVILPDIQKKENVREWLKYAVIEAEKELGSGTGQLKLRKVYNMATANFPWIVQLVSFEVFSLWVDEALEWMKNQLKSNLAIDTYVNN